MGRLRAVARGEGRAASLWLPWVATLLLVLGAACGAPSAPRPNVLLVTLDTTRPDHLGCYGYRRDTSPHLDRLARDAVVYQRAYSTTSWTLPAHASLFTGKFPTSHGAVQDPEGPVRLTKAVTGREAWERHRVHPLRAGERTLAALLAERGYRTGGVVAGPWMKRVFGLAHGFEWYDDDGITSFDGRRAEDVTDAALGFLDRVGDEPFFLFLNYYDPHTPYAAPGRFRFMFVGDEWGRGKGTLSSARYDGEIRYMDEHLGRLLDALRERDLYDATLIVVTADHGELLGEHGESGHGYHLYEQELRIPLVVKAAAGDRDGAGAGGPIQLVDVFAMVLAALGVEAPPDSQGGLPPDIGHPVVAEVAPIPSSKRWAGDWRALVDHPFKLVWNSRGNHLLFDLEEDPAEARNLYAAQGDRFRAMETRLRTYLDALPQPAPDGPERVVDEQTREALRGLGYVE